VLGYVWEKKILGLV